MKRRLFISGILGFLGHIAFYDVIQKYSSVPDLYSYGVGILIFRTAFANLLRIVFSDPCVIARAVRAFDLAAACVGSGVVSGRFVRLIARGNGQESS